MVQKSERKPVSEWHAPPKAGSACDAPCTGVPEEKDIVPAAAGLVKDASGPGSSETEQLGTTAATAEALRVIRGAKRLKSQGTQQERMEVAR